MNKAPPIKQIASRFFKAVSEKGDLGRILRGAGHVMMIRIVGGALLYGSQIIIARWLGPNGFGAYSYVWAWVWLLAIPASLGLPGAVIRFIPEYGAQNRSDRLFGFYRWSRRTVLIAGFIVSALAISLTFVFESQIRSDYLHPLRIALVCVPVTAFFNLQSSVARALGKTTLSIMPTQVLRPILLVFLGYLWMIWLSPVTAEIFVGIGVVSYLLVVLCQKHGIDYALQSRFDIHTAEASYIKHHWIRISLPLMLIAGSQIILTQIDLVMVGILTNPEKVAIYTAAIRTAALISTIQMATNFFIIPKASEMNTEKRHEALQHLTRRVTKWVFAGSGLAFLGLVVFGQFILNLFGQGYSSAYTPLLVISFSFVFSAGMGPVAGLLNVTGHQDRSALILIGFAVVNIALNYLLIPRFGILGAAIATGVTLCGSQLVLWIFVQRHLKINSCVFLGSRAF